MKKTLAILLALMLVLVNVAALAAEGDGEGEGGSATAAVPAYEAGQNPTQAKPLSGTVFTVDKKYTLTVDQNAKLPADAITYSAELVSILKSTITTWTATDFPVTISADDLNTDMKNAAVTGAEKDFAEKIKVTLPNYTKVGIYTYKVTETGKNAAGVGYTDNEVYMKVTVINADPADPTQGVVVAGISFRKEQDTTGEVTDNKKLGNLTNDYKSGTLVVEKEVTGNMGEVDRDFTFTITLTSAKDVLSKITYALSTNAAITNVTGATNNTTEKTLDAGDTGWKEAVITATLRDTDTITLYNIPDGVEYTITETSEADHGYETTGEVKEKKAIAAGTATTEKITNKKDVPIDTGVTVDTLPYIMILAVAMIGALLVLRKREEY